MPSPYHFVCLYFYLFIYFWLCWVRAFSSCGEQGFLTAVASLVEYRLYASELSGCGMWLEGTQAQQLWLTGSRGQAP